MKKLPKVSIILPFYKKISFFKKTYDSIIRQNYKFLEIIIIYDDPDKKELFRLRKIVNKNKKVKIIINKKNIGAGLSRNKAIKYATGKLIAFLDCDDIWRKNKLKNQISFMQKNNIQFSYTSYEIIDENGKKLNKVVQAYDLNYENLLRSCDIGLSTVVVERAIISKFKFPDMRTKEDFVIWLKIAKKNIKLKGINQNLCSWRKSSNSLSSSFTQKFFDAFKVYNYFEKKNIFISIFLTIRLSFNFLLKYYLKTKNRI